MKLDKTTKWTVQIGDYLQWDSNVSYRVTNICKYLNGGLSFTLQFPDGRQLYCYPSSELYGCEIVKSWKRARKPFAFYTGGGMWLSAMYISDHYYIVTDNDMYDDGFCIYDDHQDDETSEPFMCQGYIGEKHTWDFDEQDWIDFTAMRSALNDAMN